MMYQKLLLQVDSNQNPLWMTRDTNFYYIKKNPQKKKGKKFESPKIQELETVIRDTQKK